MAVFLTGCGLVGYWVAKGLVSEGEDVILYDMKQTQFDQADSKKMTFIQGDLLDYPRLVDVFQTYDSRSRASFTLPPSVPAGANSSTIHIGA